MKIGLVSDTHGNLPYLKRAGQYLKEKERVGLIVHLGDDDADADILNGLGLESLKVPGIFGSYYQDPAIPNRIVKEIEGVKLLMTHSPQAHPNDLPEDKDPQDIIRKEGIKAVFYGHTHSAGARRKNGVLWINPGHLCVSDKKGRPASFAVVDIKNGRISVKFVKYNEILKGV